MKIYLAARYSRREELCRYREQLEAAGHTITSGWLDGQHQLDVDGRPIGDHGESLIEGTGYGAERAAERMRIRFASGDLTDLRSASCVISFTEPPNSPYSRGGRHVEFGVAVAQRKSLVVVGYRENLFHYLPGIRFFADWEECLAVFRINRVCLPQ